MKKIISRYYFFVVMLLVIVYQEFSSLILYSDFAASLSGFACSSCYDLVRKMATNQQ